MTPLLIGFVVLLCMFVALIWTDTDDRGRPIATSRRREGRAMSFVHLFYQTRWALRNDPALGYLMLAVLVPTFEFGAVFKSLRRHYYRRDMLVHLMIALESADAGREEK